MTNVGLVCELYDSFIKILLFIVIIFEIYILIGKQFLGSSFSFGIWSDKNRLSYE
jgi:hypothetical protein